MKAILSMALVLGACGLAAAADEKAADPVGKWKCEYEIGGQKRTSTLTVKKEGDKLVGTMGWADQKDEKLKDPKFKDGKLTFSAVRKFQGNTIPIDYTLKIDGDEFKGKGEADFGGQSRSSTSRARARRRTRSRGQIHPCICILPRRWTSLMTSESGRFGSMSGGRFPTPSRILVTFHFA